MREDYRNESHVRDEKGDSSPAEASTPSKMSLSGDAELSAHGGAVVSGTSAVSSEPLVLPAERPVLAALANPAARRMFAHVILETNRDEPPTRRSEQALVQLEQAGLIVSSDGGWHVNEAGMREALRQDRDGRPKSGLERFLTRDGRIDRLPANRSERYSFLCFLAPRVIAINETLTEKEVNERLESLGGDVALLRRLFVDHGILERDPAGSRYRLRLEP